jgi:DNA-binding response OmpR family regulator
MKKILLIDDDKSTLESLGSYLAELGYDIETASDGLEGLELVKNDTPDLIISDVTMPKLDGIELYRLIKGMKYEIPVIFTSAYDSNEKRVEELGTIKYIQKPINIFELNKHIKTILEEHEESKV